MNVLFVSNVLCIIITIISSSHGAPAAVVNECECDMRRAVFAFETCHILPVHLPSHRVQSVHGAQHSSGCGLQAAGVCGHNNSTECSARILSSSSPSSISRICI